jgi:hypothetical protein
MMSNLYSSNESVEASGADSITRWPPVAVRKGACLAVYALVSAWRAVGFKMPRETLVEVLAEVGGCPSVGIQVCSYYA